jgi:2-amino-4-hydroxy-6-hydroxymethyldihydropteridine diphosphokinase
VGRSLRVAIAIGSNLGDRRAAIAFAADRLGALIHPVTLSDSIETEPAGTGLEGQPLYLNAVAVGETALGARELLDALLTIERDYGRERPYPGAPRTLDLDLILLGDSREDSPGLHVPHPRFRERFFVLGPLAEIAPEMVDPVTGLRVWELLRNLLRDEER